MKVDPKARLVYTSLRTRGFKVFFDKECLPGGAYGPALTRIIGECKVMVPIITRQYLDVERMNKRGAYHFVRSRRCLVCVARCTADRDGHDAPLRPEPQSRHSAPHRAPLSVVVRPAA